MNDQTIYWLWIQRSIGYGSKAIGDITGRYTFAEDIYRASVEEKVRTVSKYPNIRERIKNDDLTDCADIIKRCRKCGVEIISYGDALYPQLLKKIDSPPAVLFIKGDPEALSQELCIGVVGTRNVSETGRRNAFEFAYALAKQNVCVVSGGAVGVDAMAHRGVVKAGGRTVCVLGCGHMYRYLPQYEDLKKEIIKNGAVISEYPPDYAPSKNTFPTRNRIISGLSKGILVVEAGSRSGSLITADQAKKQGRDIFAIPCRFDAYSSPGTNELIKQGAYPAEKAEDILKRYIKVKEKAPSKESGSPKDITAEVRASVTDPVNEILQGDFREYILSTFAGVAPDIEAAVSTAQQKDGLKHAEPAKKKKRTAKTDDTPKPVKQAGNEEKKEKTAAQQPGGFNEEELSDLSENAVMFLKALSDGELHIDTVAEKTGLPISAVHAAATELEMSDMIESLPGRRYKLIEN